MSLITSIVIVILGASLTQSQAAIVNIIDDMAAGASAANVNARLVASYQGALVAAIAGREVALINGLVGAQANIGRQGVADLDAPFTDRGLIA